MVEKKETRQMFTALFKRYEENKETSERVVYFTDCRTRCGGLVTDSLVFTDRIAAKVIGHLAPYLSVGEAMAFLADIDFLNVKFKNTHEDLEV